MFVVTNEITNSVIGVATSIDVATKQIQSNFKRHISQIPGKSNNLEDYKFSVSETITNKQFIIKYIDKRYDNSHEEFDNAYLVNKVCVDKII